MRRRSRTFFPTCAMQAPTCAKHTAHLRQKFSDLRHANNYLAQQAWERDVHKENVQKGMGVAGRSVGQRAEKGPLRSLDGELLPFSHAFGASNGRRTNAVIPLRGTAPSTGPRSMPFSTHSLRNVLPPPHTQTLL